MRSVLKGLSLLSLYRSPDVGKTYRALLLCVPLCAVAAADNACAVFSMLSLQFVL